eukprot:scaffold633_cov134-Isochrysis_galbana.AAC.11
MSSLRCAERHSLGPGRGLAATSPSTYALLWSLRDCTLHRGTGEPARFTSQNHITDCSAELCRTSLSHHDSERARAPKDMLGCSARPGARSGGLAPGRVDGLTSPPVPRRAVTGGAGVRWGGGGGG